MTMLRFVSWILFLGLLPFASPGLAQTSLEFSPQGPSKQVTQVRAHFSADVIAFGQGEAAAPFRIDCAFPGQGRWVSSRDWVFDFYDEIPAGEQCRFSLILDKDRDGRSIAGEKNYVFDTGGPNVVSIQPQATTYNRIDEEQLFVLTLDSEVDRGSLKGTVTFQIPQIANPVAAKLISEEDLAASDPDYLKSIREGKKPFLLLQAESRFPSGKTIHLHWGEGVKSRSGVPNRQAQTFEFTVRDEFKAQIRCEESSEGAGCSPLDPITLSFSAEVPEEQGKNIRIEGLKPGTEIEKDEFQWRIPGPHVPLSSYRISFADAFRDDAGRPLPSAYKALEAKVGKYPPLIKFQGDFGILEAKGNPILPVHLRSVETETKVRLLRIGPQPREILPWFGKARTVSWEKEMLGATVKGREIRLLPRSYGHDAFEVKGLDFPKTGYYLVEISSAELGAAYAKTGLFVRTEVLVTDLAVHWKESEDNSLVWVTSLATGRPVADATIRVLACDGREEINGKTDSSGVFFIRENSWKKRKKNCPPSWRHGFETLFIHATRGDDYSFVSSDQNRGLETWRFGLESGYSWQDLYIHSILDRPLIRRGETLSGLALARRRVLTGFSLPKISNLSASVEFVHQGSGRRFPSKATWDRDARAAFQWVAPSDAPLGAYDIVINQQTTGQFQLKEFRVATVKTDLRPAMKDAIAGKSMTYHFDVSYLNGGSAGGLPVTLRAEILGDLASDIPGSEGYLFNKGPSRKADGEETIPTIAGKKASLDKAGHGEASLDFPAVERPTLVRVELEFPDPNGELRTQSLHETLWPAALQIGLKVKQTWLKAGDKLDVLGLARNLQYEAVATQFVLRVRERKTLSHRRRGIGGTYTYQHKTIISEPSPICEVKSDANGAFHCKALFAKSGSYIIEAEAKDADGRKAISSMDVWVSGRQDWYEADDNDRIDLIPEKKEYEAGEVARLKVMAPFPEATMLVAVEREGIERYEVREFDAKNPILEIPIERQHAPNIYVSAWLMRGRSKGTEPFLKVDLGKPAFKLGIAEIKVGRKAHTLEVKVESDRTEYQPRDKVKAHIRVSPPKGQALPENTAVTLVALDEGLLELEKNPSWDLLEAMMGRRPYTIEHASDAMFVIGKRHFGLKALPSGGGGGRSSTRELFETLLLWKALVPLQNGEADVEIPLNDSLSSFRIVAVAHAGSDLFGKGETTVRSSKALSIISGLPPFARSGDRFQGEITLRNRSEKAMTVQVEGRSSAGLSLPSQTVKLSPQDSQRLHWDIEAPAAGEASYTFEAKSDEGSADAIQIRQTLAEPIPVQVLQSQMMAVAGPLSLPVQKPKNATQGDLRIAVKSSLAPTALEGPSLYMRDYPYSCSEQQMSRAIVLNQESIWRRIDYARYLDRQGLMTFFPASANDNGSPELTAYALELSAARNWELPEKERMLDALQDFISGRLAVRSRAGTIVLHEKIRALAALQRHRKLQKDFLADWDIQPDFMPLSTLVDLLSIVGNDPHPLREGLLKALNQRLEFRGSVLQVKIIEGDSTLLASPDATMSRLLLAALELSWKTEDSPELFKGLLARQVRGRWDTTVANALGALATRAFHERFEKTAVSGETEWDLAGRKGRIDPKSDAKPLVWPWPEKEETLRVEHQGKGQPWMTLVSRAAIPLTQGIYSGFQLTKAVKDIERKSKGQANVGDIYEVELTFESRTAHAWVSLSDPIPAGARVLPYSADEASYVEKTFQGATAYFDSLAPGTHRFRYRFQLNTAGRFQLPPTRIEAMYAPEVFAVIPNAPWEVR